MEISAPAGYNKQYVDSTLILNQEVSFPAVITLESLFEDISQSIEYSFG